MPSTTQNVNQMRELRLNAMVQAYELQQTQPSWNDISFDDRFGMLLEAEVATRNSRKLSRLIKVASLPEQASLEDLDMRASRGLDKGLMATLFTCSWIDRGLNMLIVGPTGLGKTWIACAFANQAGRLNKAPYFRKFSDLYVEIAEAQVDGSMAKLKAALCKPKLLVLDDFGMGEMTPAGAQVLLDVADRRKAGSFLITSQYPVEKWHGFFPDPTIAEAVLDRIVHNAHKLQLKGDSMRKTRGRAAVAGG